MSTCRNVYVRLSDILDYIHDADVKTFGCDCEPCREERMSLRKLRDTIDRYPDTKDGVPQQGYIPIWFHQPNGTMWNKYEDLVVNFRGKEVKDEQA